MKQWLADPVVQVCVSIILIGLISLIWAMKTFMRLASASDGTSDVVDRLPVGPDLREIDFKSPVTRPTLSVAPAPAVSKDVSERLDSMSQRLSEMQSVLTKQATVATGVSAGGAVGQGFSPETIDKLLKIIGNVIQQVDILQKSVNTNKDV